MRSELPKVLHPVCGRPMVEWVIEAARAGGRRACRLRGHGRATASARTNCRTASRSSSRRRAREPPPPCWPRARASSRSPRSLILSGDHPLIDGQLLADLAARPQRRQSRRDATHHRGARSRRLRTNRPRRRRRRRADRRDQAHRRRRAGGARHPRDQHRHLRLRRPGALLERSTRSSEQDGERYLTGAFADPRRERTDGCGTHDRPTPTARSG